MLTIATFNLCNFGTDAPPARLRRLALTISGVLAAPDILAVQEVTAPGPGDFGGKVAATGAYSTLASAILAADGPFYAHREVPPLAQRDGGLAGANIRVGLLFNPERVTFVDRGDPSPERAVSWVQADGQVALSMSPGRIDPLHPAFEGDARQGWLPSRKALAGEFRIGPQRLFVVVCHLKSMRANNRREEASAQRQRHAQAAVIQRFAGQLLRQVPDASLVILGDMNDGLNSRTLDLLKGDHLVNLNEGLERPYSHRQGGRPQLLDHVLVSKALSRGARINIPHVNSDAPWTERSSDHDPILAELPLDPRGNPEGG